jgi:hypothetical protein
MRVTVELRVFVTILFVCVCAEWSLYLFIIISVCACYYASCVKTNSMFYYLAINQSCILYLVLFREYSVLEMCVRVCVCVCMRAMCVQVCMHVFVC